MSPFENLPSLNLNRMKEETMTVKFSQPNGLLNCFTQDLQTLVITSPVQKIPRTRPPSQLHVEATLINYVSKQWCRGNPFPPWPSMRVISLGIRTVPVLSVAKKLTAFRPSIHTNTSVLSLTVN